ncbi:MAG: hypothetical protein KFH87_02530 [Bacteroidetes bacterium]|nr:hypothetical protein [Bacteroidota bacterium]
MKFFILILTITLGVAFDANAQNDPGPGGKGRERIEQLRRVKLIEALELNEEQAVRILVREKEYREEQRALKKRRDNLVDDLRSLIEDKADEAGIRKQLAAINEVNLQLVQKKHTYLLSLEDLLSIEKIGKIILFEERFWKEVRRLLINADRPSRR